MAPPKSDKLAREEAITVKQAAIPQDDYVVPVYGPDDKIKIKELTCYNDYVALVQFRINSRIELSGDASYKQEGLVVGVGPGIPASDGKRCPSQLIIGDVVSFYGRPTLELNPTEGVYAGRRVVITSERSVICKLPSVPFERVDLNKDDSKS
jgi:co-chaperonin GroES (HSP10)